ncbi:MAG: AAA family ATPase [Faecousia sp.]
MLFYTIIASMEEAEEPVQSREAPEDKELAGKLLACSEANYQQNGQNHYFFAKGIKKTRIQFGAVFKSATDVLPAFSDYLQEAGMAAADISIQEISFTAFRVMLSFARAKELIRDDEEVLRRFELDRLRSNYGEALIEGNQTKEELMRQSRAMLCEETLLPELRRIYTKKRRRCVRGHPVHYMICCDDRDSRKEILRVLLEALYANGRIRSKRYCLIDFERSSGPSEFSSYDALFKSCEDGTLMILYQPAEDSDSDRTGPGEGWICAISDLVKKYRNRVLTVFCLPTECAKIKELFFENLSTMSFVELYEDNACGNRAREYLKTLADKYELRPDKQLYGKIEDDARQYRAAQLKLLFEEWYGDKLRHSVYPQYKGIKSTATKIIQKKPRGSAIDTLNGMIGLQEAKAVIRKALDYFKVQKLYRDRGLQDTRPTMHMVFTGNPGTAKTTVARLFAQIMRDNGLLSGGELYEVGRADLVGKYVGWTAQLVKQKFREARGSVLFIDEAYSLLDDRNGLYGDEAINTIVQEMENNRDNMVVIFAGYPDPMEQFLSRNPGLRSRIAFHVPFPDYNTEELVSIAELLAGKKGLHFTQQACDKLRNILSTARTSADFGNGRYVRSLLEQAGMEQASRIVKMNGETLTEETLRTLTAEDIPDCNISGLTEKRRIGFDAIQY